jgi:predicted alpha/beta-fold hydrolase
MPVTESTYKAPLFFGNAHIQTCYPTLFRKVDTSGYTRERISTRDGDFLDLDWATGGRDRLAIILHGLEGNSQRAYAAGMVRALNNNGWDALALNFRGCGGEINRTLRSYHSGATDDLERVIEHAVEKGGYTTIALIGFSLGGNVVLVYLGKKGEDVNPRVKRAAVFSVPCDLRGSAMELKKPKNKIYMNRFLKLLHKKVEAKMAIMPEKINDQGYHQLKDFQDFDDRYTAPIHGFKDAEDYWKKCSGKQFLHRVVIPTLIVNAKDDPFLAPSCFPIREAEENNHVFLEIPTSGGHMGFIAFNEEKLYWSEKRAMQFLNRAH